MLQEAEDSYYINAKHILELSERAYELFKSSEVSERRQLIKLVLSNLRVEGREVRYEAVKPFDTILTFANRQSWIESRTTNITTKLNCIINMFSDTKFSIEVKEEIKNVTLLYPAP